MRAALNGRITKLERLEPPPAGGVSKDFDLDAEWERWADLLEPAFRLLEGDGEADQALEDTAVHWFDWFHGIPIVSRPPLNAERFVQVRRWPNVLALFFKLCPGDLAVPAATWGLAREPLGRGLTVAEGRRWHWLHNWLMGVTRLHSRLPPDLAPEALARLVRVYLNRHAELWGYQDVCVACGLELPQRDYALAGGKFFDACPHCGGRETWPAGRSDERTFAWRDLARAELGSEA
jgi:hypothetical protein